MNKQEISKIIKHGIYSALKSNLLHTLDAKFLNITSYEQSNWKYRFEINFDTLDKSDKKLKSITRIEAIIKEYCFEIDTISQGLKNCFSYTKDQTQRIIFKVYLNFKNLTKNILKEFENE